MESVSQWGMGDGFQGKAIALALRDPQFLHTFSDVFEYHYFEHEHLIVLARMVREYYQEYKHSPSHDVLISLILNYTQKYGGPQAATLQASLMQWVSWIYSLDLGEDGEYVRDQMVEFGQRQAMKSAVDKVLTILERPDGDVTKVRSIIDDALRVGSTRSTGMNFGAIAMDLPKILQEDPTYGTAYKVPTGISALDSRLNGGMGAGEIFVVLAPPGVGKSTLMVNMGKAALFHFAQSGSNKAVVHVTMELKEHDIALKYACSMTGCTTSEVQSGSPSYSERISTSLPYVQDQLRIKYFSPSSLTVEELYWFVGTLCSMEGVEPGVIIVDYADKLRVSDRRGRYEGMGDVYHSLIAMGDAYKCPIITGSQVNRANARESVIMQDGVGDSWRKAESADCIISINQNLVEYQNGGLRIFMAKVRRGANLGVVYCHSQFDRASIWEMSEEQATAFQAAVETSARNGVGGKKHASASSPS